MLLPPTMASVPLLIASLAICSNADVVHPSQECSYYVSSNHDSLPLPIGECATSTASSSSSYHCAGVFVSHIYQYKYHGPNCQGTATITNLGNCEEPNCKCSGETDGQCTGVKFTVDGVYNTEDEENVTVLMDQCINSQLFDTTTYNMHDDRSRLIQLLYSQNDTECARHIMGFEKMSFYIPWTGNGGNGGDGGHGSDDDGDRDDDITDDDGESEPDLVVTDRKLLDLIIIFSGLFISMCAVCCAALVHRQLKRRAQRQKKKRKDLKQKLVQKRKKDKENEEMRREGVPEIIFNEDDGYSGSDSVEVDEIALVAVPMPAFAESLISGNDKPSDQEKGANDAASAIDGDDDGSDGNGDEMESEEEGEGQGFDESD